MPYLSLFQSGDPNPEIAAPAVRRALQVSGQSGTSSKTYSGSAPVVDIEAVAGIKFRLAVRREAIVSLTGQNGVSPFKLLSLTDGSP
jgi:hypothetical protein